MKDDVLSTESPAPVWSDHISATILRRKSYKHAISLTRGRTFVLHFSVFQHDVGFSMYFNATAEGENKAKCMEVGIMMMMMMIGNEE